MSKPIIAIVGRPNVGKSTLFNKLTGKRLAIVEDTPGVTRDRIYSECEWLNHTVMLVDTGGIEPKTDDDMLSKMRNQANIAIESADVIVLVTDIASGVTANDADIASMLLKSGKPIVLCVNKCDRIGDLPAEFYEFYNLGLGDPIAVSSVHGHGTGDLLDACFEHIDFDKEDEYDDDSIKVAIIGKPNVGKSSLVNKIAGEERVIVSNIAGTTRDATDTKIENEYGKFIFIDTAGLRRKKNVKEELEHFMVLRTVAAVERADVCVLVIDAETGIVEHDKHIAGYALEAGKPTVIVVNKWDTVEDKDESMKEWQKKISHNFQFMDFAKVVFLSAQTKKRIHTLMPEVLISYNNSIKEVKTNLINDIIQTS